MIHDDYRPSEEASGEDKVDGENDERVVAVVDDSK